MAEKHVLYTGPISGEVQLADGSRVNVSPAVLEFETLEEAAEVAHAIGLAHAKAGHPDDVDIDEKTGERIQRKFEYDDSHHRKHGRKSGKKG